ncbi:MAG: radical SAM protein [Flavobacteriales bacterium]|nr:radical SAM protein [Flavobacteriales bacterium]
MAEVITGWRYTLDQLRVWGHARRLAHRLYPTTAEARLALRELLKVVLENRRIRHFTRSVRVGPRTFQLLSYPGRPSAAWDELIKNELHRVRPIPGKQEGLMVLLMAMTRKCPLSCAHCFEGEVLNQRDEITADDVIRMIRNFQERGVAQVELSGGEPMNRFEELLRILEGSDQRATDFWVLTSGWNLTPERATRLKAAGLTGVAVSVDHWDPVAHDAFRGRSRSFAHAHEAVRNARDAGLVVALSLVPLRSFCNEADLLRYAATAADWGAHFIRIVEPRAVGNFAGKDVELGPSEHAALDEFVRVLHTGKRYRCYPIVDHYGSYQRAVGCSGAGRRFLYVDTAGEVHACPFCRKPCGSALHQPMEELLADMEAEGCIVHATV